MPDGIHFFFGAECAHIACAQLGQGVQSASGLHHLLNVPIGNIQRTRTTPFNFEGILQGIGDLDILRIIGIDEGTHGQVGVAGADFRLGQFVAAGLGLGKAVVVLVDDLQALIASAGFRHDHGHRFAQIHHYGGIERIAVHADDVLLIDGGWGAQVKPVAQAHHVINFFDRNIGFSTGKVSNVDIFHFESPLH